MKKFNFAQNAWFASLCLVFVGVSSIYAQNAIIGSGFTNGWNSPTDQICFDAGAGSSRIKTLNPRGTGWQYFRMARCWSGNNDQFASATLGCVGGADFDIMSSANGTLINTTSGYNCTNGSFKINCPNTTDNYVFKTNDGTGSSFLYFRVQGAVQTVTSTALSSCNSLRPTITANMSGTLVTGQAAYLRYTTDNFASSTVVPIVSVGSSSGSYSFTSDLANGAVLQYYVFTSGVATTPTHANADLMTINSSTTSQYKVHTAWTGIFAASTETAAVNYTSHGDIKLDANQYHIYPGGTTSVTVTQDFFALNPSSVTAKLFYSQATFPANPSAPTIASSFVAGTRTTVSGTIGTYAVQYAHFTFAVPVSNNQTTAAFIEYSCGSTKYYSRVNSATGVPTTDPIATAATGAFNECFQFRIAEAVSGGVGIDGVISPSEYAYSSAANNWYAKYDANTCTFAHKTSSPANPMIIYIDRNPNAFPNDVNAQNTGKSDNGVTPGLPFNADLRIYWNAASNVLVYERATSSGWESIDRKANILAAHTNISGTENCELIIDWAVLAGGAPTTTFAFTCYQISAGAIADFAPFPSTFSGATPVLHYYYEVPFSAAGNNPFARISFTSQSNNSGAGATGAFVYNNTQPTTLYNFTINDNSADNNDNTNTGYDRNTANISNRVYLVDNITIENNLYIGKGSSLVPNTGNTPTITMNGAAGSIFTIGRMDCNPNAANQAEVDATDLRYVFASGANIAIQPTAGLNKDRFRFSDVTIQADAILRAAATGGTSEFELQWGTLQVDGALNLSPNNTNFSTVGTRGNWNVLRNLYKIKGSGSLQWHNFFVGRRSPGMNLSLTQTDPNIFTADGSTMDFKVRGDFSNYSEFVAKANGGNLKIIMNGTQDQYIRANYQETRRQNSNTGDQIAAANSTGFPNTTGGVNNDIPRTVFSSLEINNTGATGNVFFSTDPVFDYQGNAAQDESEHVNTNVRYMITDALKMTSGRLITRKRIQTICPDVEATNTNFHILTLMDAATVSYSDDKGGATSSYVDGPIRWEVKNTNLAKKRFFPIGKTSAYRGAELAISAQADAAVVYDGELYSCQPTNSLNNTASANGKAASEKITALVQPRHWNIHHNRDNVSGLTGAVSATVTFSYDTDDFGACPSAGHLRVVKAPTGNSGQWLNISGGGAGSSGTILTDAFSSFSDFIFGRIGSVLPVKMVYFEANADGKTSELTWKTASEENNANFIVEHSSNGVDFTEIGTVRGNGTTNIAHIYNFTHTQPAVGNNYYRLRQVDFDGKYEISEIRIVKFDTGNSIFAVNPNPTQNDNINIRILREIENDATVELFDITGKLILHENIANLQFSIDTKNLAKNMYLVRITTNTQAQTERVLVQ